jgi:hypothetical protein
MNNGAGLSLTAFFIVASLLFLSWYMQQRHDLSAEIVALRERFNLTNEQTAELLSSAWNAKYPDNERKFDEKTIRRWQAGQPPSPITHLRMMKILDDPVLFDAIADYARREDLDILDALVGRRQPNSPSRIVCMTTEAFESFYSEELSELKGHKNVNTTNGDKKVVIMTQKPKKSRKKRKSR